MTTDGNELPRRSTDTSDSVGDEVRGGHDQKTIADAGTPAFTGGPEIYTDRDILVQQLRETICSPMPVAQERPPTNDLETPSFNRFPVRTVTEEISTEGCFSCGEWTHNTEQCQALDESLPFLPIGWVVERNENTFSLGPGHHQVPGVIRRETTTGPGRGVGRPDQQCLQTPTPNDYKGHSATGGPMLFGDFPVR